MLNAFPKIKARGFTLIELMIGIVIFAIAMALGVPSYRAWIQNTQIRNAAESIQNGLQRARGEAVKQNKDVKFVLLGVTPTWTSSWEIDVVNPLTTIESRSGNEGSKNVTSKGYDGTGVGAAAATTITFSNLGTVVNNANTLRKVVLDSSVLSAADSRDLWIVIGANGVGGSVKMCDPNAPTTSPTKC